MFFLLVWSVLSIAATSSDCRSNPEGSLVLLRDANTDGEERSAAAQCLVKHHLDQPELIFHLVRIIKNPSEDTLLREDILDSLASISWRKTIRLEGELAPKLEAQDKLAVNRTAEEVSGLLAVVGAVKTMDEIVPVSRQEGELVRAMADVASAEESPILIKTACVRALERYSIKASESGVYDSKVLRIATEALRLLANVDEDVGYFTGANVAYAKVSGPGYASRSLASEPKLTK